MALTTAQQATLKAHIAASPDLNTQPAGSDGAFEIARLLNENAVPPHTVWKNNVTETEILKNGMDWTRVDNLQPGPARIWEWMFKFGNIDPSKANIRAGIEAVWKGTAADLAVRASVYGHCKTLASRVEKLFAIGAGSDAAPATRDFVGPISWQDVEIARTS